MVSGLVKDDVVSGGGEEEKRRGVLALSRRLNVFRDSEDVLKKLKTNTAECHTRECV